MTKKPTRVPPGTVTSLMEKLGVEGVVRIATMSPAELRAFKVRAGLKRKPARRRKARERRAIVGRR